MEFKSEICTTMEQSKRLLSLGVKKETADMAYEYVPILERWIKTEFKWEGQNITEFRIPAWGFHRLIELVDNPYAIKHWIGTSIKEDYDHLIDMIALIIERKELNENYLEKKEG